jgi:cell division ATPase FtsA
MGKRLQRCFLALALTLLATLAWADDARVEVIPLHYSRVEDVLPLIQPLVGEGGVVNGMNGRLVVRAAPADMARIKQVLAEIDRAPRRLMISVRQSGTLERAAQGARLSGSVGGAHGRVSLPDDRGHQGGTLEIHSGDDSLRARADASQTSQSRDETQRIQALEGYPAFIQAGISQPVSAREAVVNARGVVVYDTTRYHDVVRGFYVVARVAGARVTLEIRTRNDTPARRYGEARVEEADTVVSGRLGEWIEVGGISQDSGARTGFSGGVEERATRERQGIYLKVEELD